MSIQICGAPCCWGVDDPKNPYLPPWTRVLEEAGKVWAIAGAAVVVVMYLIFSPLGIGA